MPFTYIKKRDSLGRILEVGGTIKPKICKGCKVIYQPKSNRQTYCAKECFYRYSNRDKIGKTRSTETKKKLSKAKLGSLNPMWRGGASSDRLKAINTQEYKRWRKTVFERDNYTCQYCGVRGGRLNADHKVPWSISREKRFDLDNGQTLCVKCHSEKTAKENGENWKNQYGRA